MSEARIESSEFDVVAPLLPEDPPAVPRPQAPGIAVEHSPVADSRESASEVQLMEDAAWDLLEERIAASTPDISGFKEVEVPPDELAFWMASEPLRRTFQGAQAAGVAPAAVLLNHLARLTAQVPPEVQGPDLVGKGAIALNWNGVIYGASGSGKSTAYDVSRSCLILEPEIELQNPGSGEGIRSLFGQAFRVHDQWLVQRTAYAALFVADEIATVAAQAARKGSTYNEVVRIAFGGRQLGNRNAGNESNVQIPAGCYRLVTLLNMQPAYGSLLWAEHEVSAGTPQRFVFVDASRTWLRRPENRPPPPKPIVNPLAATHILPPGMDELGCYTGPEALMGIPGTTVTDYSVMLGREDLLKRSEYSDRPKRWIRDQLPPEFARYMTDFATAAALGRIPAERSHEPLLVLKIAYALGFLHGRTSPQVRDLQLAQVFIAQSVECGARIRRDMGRRGVEVAKQAGVRAAQQRMAELTFTAEIADRNIPRAMQSMVGYMSRRKGQQVTRSQVVKSCASSITADIREAAWAELLDRGIFRTVPGKRMGSELVILDQIVLSESQRPERAPDGSVQSASPADDAVEPEAAEPELEAAVAPSSDSGATDDGGESRPA